MRDRESTKLGRVLLTPENGDAPFYAVMEMADEPTDFGTPPTKANLLTDETEVALFGNAADRTVNQAFAGIAGKLRLIMDDMANVTVHLVSANGNGLAGALVTGLFDESGNEVFTDLTGTATGYVSAGEATLTVSGYIDLTDVSETFTAVKGETYEKTLTTTTKNFVRIDSSRSVKFSGNVSRIDHTVVGGGGGGGGGVRPGSSEYRYPSGAGGGGGYCVVTENAAFLPNTSYSAVIGSGGAAGTTSDESYGGDGGKSSFMGVSAAGGKGGAPGVFSSDGTTAKGGTGNGTGGNGVYASSSTSTSANGKAGSPGTVPGYASFTETVLYGGGGGGGSAWYKNGSAVTGGAGGADYGGEGSSVVGSTGYFDGQAGRGPGGGGGGSGARYNPEGTRRTSAGAGHKGCVAIRMHLIAA